MIRGTLDERLALRKDEKYIIDTILPAGEVHLIGGASGAGKTTWLLHWLRDWSEGKPVLGFRSYPVPFVYVSFDRGTLTLDRTLRRMRMADWNFPAYDIAKLGLPKPDLFNIVNRFPEAQLFVIEGFQGCLDDAPRGTSQNKADMLWSMQVRKKITGLGKTILGVTHSPKMKQGESYVSSRSRFLGTQSLLASTGTLITFDNPKDVRDATTPVRTDDREILIEGPNFASITLNYTRDANGKFVKYDEQTTEGILNLDCWIITQTGVILSTGAIKAYGVKIGMSERSVERWISEREREGTLEKVDKGRFRHRAPQ